MSVPILTKDAYYRLNRACRAVAKERRLTASQIAAALDLSPSVVAMALKPTGNRVPTTLLLVAAYLDVPVEEQA